MTVSLANMEVVIRLRIRKLVVLLKTAQELCIHHRIRLDKAARIHSSLLHVMVEAEYLKLANNYSTQSAKSMSQYLKV